MYLPADFKNPVAVQKKLLQKPEDYWQKRGEKRVLALFHAMAERVPAYKDFLKKQGINAETIKTISDFKLVPSIDKNNYLRAYPLEAVCWEGKLKEKRWTFSVTSGSTGAPFYFPREDSQDWQYAALAELYLRTNFRIQEKSTLYIDAFAMGAWIGGLFTYAAIRLAAQRGNYQLSVITPGAVKAEVLKAFRALAGKFDQVLIGGYPPFVKDVIDDGIAESIDWHAYNLGFIFSAEPFSEKWRDYVIKKTGLKNPYRDTLNHYGTVDLGTMSYETPLSILIRRKSVEEKTIYDKIFPNISKLPTLTQFFPELFFFEGQNGGLFCSAFSGLPLVRYDLKDHGGVISYEKLRDSLQKDINIQEEAKSAKIEDTIWQLPFVYVYERSDFAVSLSGANIYPETIRKALAERKFENMLTGKFTMLIQHDEAQNPYLEIDIELKRGAQQSGELEQDIREVVVRQLLSENSEYKVISEAIPECAVPKIVLWEYEHPLHFSPGGKQKWVKK